MIDVLTEYKVRENSPEAVSEVKGLFNRVVKQDQWDWFAVFQQLGCLGRKKCRAIVYSLTDLRNAITEKV